MRFAFKPRKERCQNTVFFVAPAAIFVENVTWVVRRRESISGAFWRPFWLLNSLQRGVLVHKNSLASFQQCRHGIKPRALTCPCTQSNLSACHRWVDTPHLHTLEEDSVVCERNKNSLASCQQCHHCIKPRALTCLCKKGNLSAFDFPLVHTLEGDSVVYKIFVGSPPSRSRLVTRIMSTEAILWNGFSQDPPRADEWLRRRLKI